MSFRMMSGLRTALRAQPLQYRLYSAQTQTARALYYENHGNPESIVKGLTFDLPKLEANEVRVKFALSTINPADINVLQGVYPSKPQRRDGLSSSGPVYIPGNEGLGVIEETGSNADSSLSPGDWVIMAKSQLGTWSSRLNLPSNHVIKVPRSTESSPGQRPITQVEAATLGVNPTTAYRLLADYGSLKPGDWVIQNAANSAVGIAVIQIAKARGIKTINLVRARSDFDSLKQRLEGLGADVVMTYEDIAAKEARQTIKDITQGKAPLLGLNCVGGKTTTDMMKFLGSEAHLVTYGGMSKEPVSIPTSLFIFKNIVASGFWMSKWYTVCSMEERKAMVKNLAEMIEKNNLQAPDVEIVKLNGSDDQISQLAIQAITKSTQPGVGKKILLQFED